LNSYTQEETANQEEEKLKAIIGQQKVVRVETEETKIAAKKDHLFLLIVLVILVVIYFGLKLFPIHRHIEHR
jgi:Na+/H+ antiporter NhaC